MNDWDNFDNLPTDDDDNDDFDWLNDNDDSASDDDDLSWLSADEDADEDDKPQEWQMPRSDRAEQAIASQIEDAETAEFGDTEEGLDWMSENDEVESVSADLDMPDWLSGMEVPSASDEDIAAAQVDALGTDDSSNDAWGIAPDDDDESDDAWGVTSDNKDDNDDLEGESWLSAVDDDDDEDIDDFLLGISSDDSDDEDTWNISSESDDDSSSLFGISSDSDEDSDDGWGISLDDDDDDDFLSSSQSDDGDDSDSGWGIPLDEDQEVVGDLEGESWLSAVDDDDDDDDIDDFLFGTSSDDNDEDFGDWGDISDSDFEDTSAVSVDDGWDLNADDVDFEQVDAEFVEDPSSEQEDLAVPDWLSDMPLPEVIEPVARQNVPLPSDNDLGIPEWLTDSEASNETPSEFSDELDFMNDLNTPTPELEDDLGVPDWLASDDEDIVDEAIAEVSDDDLSDLLGGLAESDDDDDLGDLLASLDTDGDDENLDDLLASLDMGEDEVELDDLFASLEGRADDVSDELEDLLLDSDPVAESDELDDLDFLEPVAESDELDDLDFLEPVSEADELDDLDFLEPVSEADELDDLDFLEPVADFDDVIEDEEDLEFSFLSDVEEIHVEDIEDDIFADIQSEEDDEFELLNQLNNMKTSDLDFMEGISRVQEGIEQGDIDVDDLEDDELALLNKLSAMKTSDLDFMEGISREEEFATPELDDDELAVLNRLSAMRTSDLSFMEGITRVQEGIEQGDIDVDDLEDDELALLNKLSAMKTSDLDFMEGISREEEFATPELDDDEIAILNRLSAMRTSDLSFMEGISREQPESDTPVIDDDEIAILNQLGASRTSDLDFMDGISRDEPMTKTPDIDGEELSMLNELSKRRTSELDFMEGISRDDDDFFQENDQADLSYFDATDDGDDLQEWFDSQDAKPPTGSLGFLDNIPPSVDDEPDWLDEISGIDTDTLREAAESANKPSSVDIDALIDSFGMEDSAFDADNEISPAADLDAIFGAMDEETLNQLPDDLPAEALPDWLQEIAKGTDAASAAALIRQRSDRSLDDLDDRLLELRERGLELSSIPRERPQNQQQLSKIVPNIDEALSPVQTDFAQAALITSPNISAEQAKNATLLQGLVGATTGIDTGSNQTQASRNWLQAIVSRADRIIISLLLIAGVFIPFAYSGFDGIGILPQGEFAEDSEELAAFTLVEGLTPGDYVLLAAEYGATGARELDTATRSFVEHIISNGGIPVVVSSDAVGLLRAENIVVELLGEDSRNQAYYIAGFLPGGNIGLRDFASNLNAVIRTDIRGNDTGLSLSSVDDFAAIILISESGETVRNWMEQIAPITDISIIVMTGQAARPLALPYTSSSDNTVALLTGYDDAFTYQQMSLGLYNPSATPSATATVTSTATTTPLPTATDLPTNTPTATATASDTPVPSETPTASDTPIPSLTPRPATNTPEALISDTPVPSNTPIPTVVSETTEVDLIEVAVISSESAANVRAGAGASFAVVSSIEPGEQLFIVERSIDEEWIRVVLPDGSNGWIASILLTVIEIPADEFEGETLFTDTLQIGTVVSDSRINVRSGAGSNFDAVAGLDPNTRVRIIGTSEDGEWYNIVLPNGGEGWVARFLLQVNQVPESEWDGASKDGFFPIYFDRPVQIQQGNDEEDILLIGRNAAGITMPVFVDADQSEVLLEMPNSAEFIVIAEGDPLTQILTEDGQIGFIETRIIVIEERPRSEVEFAPTPTLTPTIAPPTATLTATATFTPTPFSPQITPSPLVDAEARSSSQSLGLVIAIAVIGLGNIFWIFRWLGQREQ